ncbi:MAG: phosphatase [Clostridiales bacterium]|nr:phosphatase [Clostridiales bacterium]
MKGTNQRLPADPARPSLSDAALRARRRYQRDYYQKNREKRASWNRAYWERKATQAAPDTEREED